MSASGRAVSLSALWYRGLPQAVAVGRRRWAALSRREQWLTSTAAAVVAAALLWAVAFRPAWHTLQTTPQHINGLQQQLQVLQQQGQQLAALRNAPAVPAFDGDLQTAVLAWFQRVDPNAKIQVQVLPGEATLQFAGLRPATLVALAQAARRDWSAQVDGADLTRDADGLLSGTVHLSRQSSGGG